MNCRPCITIRTFFMLLKRHYLAFRKDLREYAKVNYYACEMPKYKETKPKNIDEAMKRLRDLRENARLQYSKEEEEEILRAINQELK